MRQQRVLDRWQFRQLFSGHDIPGRFLCLLETIPLSCPRLQDHRVILVEPELVIRESSRKSSDIVARIEG